MCVEHLLASLLVLDVVALHCFTSDVSVTLLFALYFTDADRALQLLEGYHSKLTKPQDHALRSAIERVIRIFRSQLFHSLLGMCAQLMG